MNTRLLCLAFLGSLSLVSGGLPGGQGARFAEPPKYPTKYVRDNPFTVEVSQPITREVTDYEDFTGRTEPVHRVELRPRVSGYIDKVNFKEGAAVKRGDILFEIDPRPYKADLDQAEAEMVLAEAKLKKAAAALDRAKALLKANGISQEDYANIEADVLVAKAGVQAARARREHAQLNLEFTKVTAPIDGKIGRPALTAGNLAVADKTSLGTLSSVDPMYVAFDLDERTFLRLRLKDRKDRELAVHMALGDENRFPRAGQLYSVGAQVDPKTGTIRCRAMLPNPGGQLLPGMFMRVRLVTRAPYHALLVTEQAILTDQGQKFVYVVTDKNVVERRNVKLGSSQDDGLRVVAEGLKRDDWVIVKGMDRVEPGKTVEPEKVAMPTKSPKSDEKRP
jgi:RND family efflux transporter MFP subunit